MLALVTGGFDPVHIGHLQCFNAAKELVRGWDPNGRLIVGLNSDDWLENKKGYVFMTASSRLAVVKSIEIVDHAFVFDGRKKTDTTAINAINLVHAMLPDERILFCNGGDRTKDNIPEMEYFKKTLAYDFDDSAHLTFHFGIGGDKIESSSDLVEFWKNE